LSYNLSLFPVPTGQKPEDIYKQLMRDEEQSSPAPVDGDAYAAMNQIAAWIESRVPGLTRSLSEPAGSWIQLDQPELEVRILISPRSVAITVPHFRDRAHDMLKCMRDCVTTLQIHAGYTAWDPQLDRTITPADLDLMIQQYRNVDVVLPVIRQKAKEPWWKLW
jgi:hypothetical protein